MLEIKRNNKIPNLNHSSIGRKLQLQRKPDIFKISVSHERYLSIDLHFLIATAVWEESLNNFENFKKLRCPPEFFSQKYVSRTITFHVIRIP